MTLLVPRNPGAPTPSARTPPTPMPLTLGAKSSSAWPGIRRSFLQARHAG